MSEYIPFGEEWKKEMMKFPKAALVNMLAKAMSERLELEDWKDQAINFHPSLEEK